MLFTIKRLQTTLFNALIVLTPLTNNALAEPVYHPSGPQLTFGGMTHRQLSVSDMGNPAHAAINPNPASSDSRYGAGLSIGLGIEYDAHDDLWELLNKASKSDGLAPGGGNKSDDDEAGLSGPKILNITQPDLTALLEDINSNASKLREIVASAINTVHAKAFISADIPILISNESLGGTWTFNANNSLTTNIRGLHDPIEFDLDNALQELTNAYDASQLKSGNASDTETFTLSGGLIVSVEPDGSTAFVFSNNSGTITRAAQITEISIGYSRKIWNEKNNDIYIGIEPKYYSVGLSNNFIFIDNISDAESIFDALDKSNFHYTEKVSMDIGAIWTGPQYQLGATLTNINEPEFDFPDIDLDNVSNKTIKKAILDGQTYTMERQIKLDGGYISKNGAWGINAGLDLNAVPDPMRDDYQWVSVGAGFASDNWWLPGGRVGVRKNLAGTELTYLTGGITVFNIVNIDLATTTQTVRVDGQNIPKGFILNIGAQVLF